MVVSDHVSIVHNQHQRWSALSSSGNRNLLHLVEGTFDIQKRSCISGTLDAEEAPNIAK